MKIHHLFLGLGGAALMAYLLACLMVQTEPSLKEALTLILSSVALSSAIKVTVFAFSPDSNSAPLMERDLSSGSAMLIGAFALGWFAIANVAGAFSEVFERAETERVRMRKFTEKERQPSDSLFLVEEEADGTRLDDVVPQVIAIAEASLATVGVSDHGCGS